MAVRESSSADAQELHAEAQDLRVDQISKRGDSVPSLCLCTFPTCIRGNDDIELELDAISSLDGPEHELGGLDALVAHDWNGPLWRLRRGLELALSS